MARQWPPDWEGQIVVAESHVALADIIHDERNNAVETTWWGASERMHGGPGLIQIVFPFGEPFIVALEGPWGLLQRHQSARTACTLPLPLVATVC